MVEGLVIWLLEQLDDDEAEAREALRRTFTSRRMIGGQMVDVKIEPPKWRSSAWEPGRVLTEIDVKRRIIEGHPRFDLGIEPCCRTCGDGTNDGSIEGDWPCDTLKLLALPYADRDGYRPEWAPEPA